jgi:protein BUR2
MIAKAINVMNEFYTDNPLKKSEHPYGQSPMSINMDDIDMTRSGFSGDTPRSPPPSQNGHAENGGTQSPTANGTSKEEKETPPNNSHMEPANGSSDKELKEAANDPATHEDSSHPNGMSEIITANEILHKMDSPKRKLANDGEQRVAKKTKMAPTRENNQEPTSHPTKNGSKSEPAKDEEESEEGELSE